MRKNEIRYGRFTQEDSYLGEENNLLTQVYFAPHCDYALVSLKMYFSPPSGGFFEVVQGY